MDKQPKHFLMELLQTPGVSGYEGPVQEVVRQYVAEFADDVSTDLHGNVVVRSGPESATRVMLAGHCDQIGMIVSHIDENGFLYVQTVGGWDPQQLVGQPVVVWTEAGAVAGVISRKAIHLLNESERKEVVKIEDLWIDIGATNEEEAAAKVRIGDSVTLRLTHRELLNNLLSGPALDNRSGLWVVVEAHRRALQYGAACNLFTVSTVQEEIGLRGARTAAFAVDPHIGIAVDVTHGTDCPTVDQRQRGKVSLGGGPVVVRGPNVNPGVEAALRDVAFRFELPFQNAALGRAAPNDSNALQLNRGGVATGLIAIPNRYMHSAVEVVSLDDLETAAELLARFIVEIGDRDQTRFTP